MELVRGSWELERLRRSHDEKAYRQVLQFDEELKKHPENIHRLIAKCTMMEDDDPMFRQAVPRLKYEVHQPPAPPIVELK